MTVLVPDELNEEGVYSSVKLPCNSNVPAVKLTVKGLFVFDDVYVLKLPFTNI